MRFWSGDPGATGPPVGADPRRAPATRARARTARARPRARAHGRDQGREDSTRRVAIAGAQEHPRARALDVAVGRVDQLHERLRSRCERREPASAASIRARVASHRAANSHAGAGSTGSPSYARAASVTVRCTRLPTPFARSRSDASTSRVLREIGLAHTRHLATQPPAQRRRRRSGRSAPTGRPHCRGTCRSCGRWP